MKAIKGFRWIKFLIKKVTVHLTMIMLLLQPSLKLFLLPSPPQLIQAKRNAREVIQVPSATNKGAVSFPLNRALALHHRVYFLNEGPAFITNCQQALC